MSKTNVVINFKCDVSQAHAVIGLMVAQLYEFADTMGFELTPVDPEAVEEFKSQFAITRDEAASSRSAMGIGPAFGTTWRLRDPGAGNVVERYRVVQHDDKDHPFAVRLALTERDGGDYWQGSVQDFGHLFVPWETPPLRIPAPGTYWRRSSVAGSKYRVTSADSERVTATVLGPTGDKIGGWQGTVADFNECFEEWRD